MDPSQGFEDEIRNAKPPQFPNVDEAYEQLQRTARSNTHHVPRQQGPYIICISCKFAHTLKYIGLDQIMVGIDEHGGPILRKRGPMLKT